MQEIGEVLRVGVEKQPSSCSPDYSKTYLMRYSSIHWSTSFVEQVDNLGLRDDRFEIKVSVFLYSPCRCYIRKAQRLRITP